MTEDRELSPAEHEALERSAGARIGRWEHSEARELKIWRDAIAYAEQQQGGDVVLIARCPEHGLHGQRTTCFECGGLVDQVPFTAAEQRHVERQASADELRYLPVFRRALERIADVGYTTAKDATNIARKALADRPEPRDHDREALATVTGELERAEQQKAKLRSALERIDRSGAVGPLAHEIGPLAHEIARAALAATTEDET